MALPHVGRYPEPSPWTAPQSKDGHTHQSLCWPSQGCGWPRPSYGPSHGVTGYWTLHTSQTQHCYLFDERFTHRISNTPGECFTKTKIDFKLDLTMAGHSCQYFLSSFTCIGFSRDVPIVVTNLQNFHFLIVHKDHNWETNGESNQWHEWPAIVQVQVKVDLSLCETPPWKVKSMVNGVG